MEQGTFDLAGEDSPTPVKLCECGCEQPAPIARWNNKRLGHVQGQPVRFISGHNARKPVPPASAEVHLCECGCGQPTPLIKHNRPSRGLFKGQPRRFLSGHGGKERRTGRAPHLFVEVGQRVGFGVVLEPDLRLPFNYGTGKTARGARLLCDCGTIYEALTMNLVGKNAKVKSCGCRMLEALEENRARGVAIGAAKRRGRHNGNFVDRTGQRYGRLVVLREAERPTPFGANNLSWVCLCDCGNEAIVQTGPLRAGAVKSCGCLMQERMLPPGMAGRNALLSSYRQGASTRGLAWELTDDDFDRLTSSNCFYCGYPPSAVYANGNSKYTYTGIDRADNARGYTAENSLPCCRTCNFAKRDLPYDDFLAWIARLTEYHFFHPDVMPSALLRKAAG